MADMKLYDWQWADVDHIVQGGPHGIIGSEMGTGKTLEAIMILEAWYANQTLQQRSVRTPDLIVAPLNTHDGWMDKFDKIQPEADVFRIDRKNRDDFVNHLEKRTHDVYMLHWDALRLMQSQLGGIQFNSIVADEAQRMANRKNQWTRTLKRLKARHKLPMSGTLTGDKPEGLWSALNWMDAKKFSSFWRFYETYIDYEIVYPGGFRKALGPKNVTELRKILEDQFSYIRHLKVEACCEAHPKGAMPWLGEKMYETIWVDLAPAQRRVYEEMRKQMVAWVGEHEDSPLVANVAVAQMVRLSQMALAMPLVTLGSRWDKKLDEEVEYVQVDLELPSSKADAILEKLQDNPDQKFVVCSSSKKFCYLFRDIMAKKKINSTMMSGDTPDSERLGQAERFAHDDNQVYLGVIQAMGEGIDGLQHATSTMIFADRTWSAYQNQQCEDRLHRGGQRGKVLIIDIMAHNTVDLGRRQRLVQKWEWIRALLDGKLEDD